MICTTYVYMNEVILVEFLIHAVNHSQGETSCKETLESFKREIGGKINEVRQLISEDERLIADKYSQVSRNVIEFCPWNKLQLLKWFKRRYINIHYNKCICKVTVHIIGYSCPTLYMHNASKPIYNSYYTSKISEEKKLQENTCKSLQVLEVCIHNNNLSRQNLFCFCYYCCLIPSRLLYTKIINMMLLF